MTDFNDVLNYVNNATDNELDLLFAASKRRRKAIQAQTAALNAATLKKGDRVVTKKLSPKYLVGLPGTVDRIDGDKIVVVIDEVRRFEMGRYNNYDGRVTVPASCLEAI